MAVQLTENPDEEFPTTPFHKPPTVEQILEVTRHRIQIADAELAEARRRRDLIAAALMNEFHGSRSYLNGSVAHGDALNPLTDVDLGVVVAEAKHTHGPGKKGCADLQERAATAIREALKDEFPDLRVEWKARKRSILVRFAKPVSFGQDDFTADVIVAIDNPNGEGLFIPNYAGWSRSHPEKHTELVHEANENSRSSYARVVRLLKHYSRGNQHTLCSWNIKALALAVLTHPTKLATGMVNWFDHAIDELSKGLTEDPAGVAEKPISLNKMTRTEVVERLKRDRERFTNALDLEEAGYPILAHEQLAKFFNDKDILPFPDATAVRAETARKYTAERRKSINSVTSKPLVGAAAAATVKPVVGHHPTQRTPNTRSWGAP